MLAREIIFHDLGNHSIVYSSRSVNNIIKHEADTFACCRWGCSCLLYYVFIEFYSSENNFENMLSSSPPPSIAFAYIFLHMSLFNYSQCRVFTYHNTNIEMHFKIETLFLLLEFYTIPKSIYHWIWNAQLPIIRNIDE